MKLDNNLDETWLYTEGIAEKARSLALLNEIDTSSKLQIWYDFLALFKSLQSLSLSTTQALYSRKYFTDTSNCHSPQKNLDYTPFILQTKSSI